MDKKNKRLYRIWSSMIQRCTNPKSPSYVRYKNVRIHENWRIYKNFEADLLSSYDKHVAKHGEHETTIDRIDGTSGYFPMNVRWATRYEQRMNTTNLSMHEYNGVTLCMRDWCRIFEIPSTTLWDNIKAGKDLKTIVKSKSFKCLVCAERNKKVKPPPSKIFLNAGWARYGKCIVCGTTDKPFLGMGKCTTCYGRIKSQKKRAKSKLKCKVCNSILRRMNLSSEPEGIRKDAYCRTCKVRYMVTKSMLIEFQFSK